MKIRDVMTPQVECALAQGTIAEAARKMAEQGVGVLPVIDDGVTVGLVTDRDIVRRGLARGRDPQQTPVREVMTRDIAWCERDDDLEQAARTMEQKAVRRLLVRDGEGRIGGIVSLGDLARSDGSDPLAGRVLASICRAS